MALSTLPDASRPTADVHACVACGSQSLSLALRVAGDPGRDGLIPSTTQFGHALSDIVRCQNCGHMQLARLPAAPTLLAEYQQAESGEYLAEEAGQRITARRLLE